MGVFDWGEGGGRLLSWLMGDTYYSNSIFLEWKRNGYSINKYLCNTCGIIITTPRVLFAAKPALFGQNAVADGQ